MKTINEMFRSIIALNEGGESVAYRFSDPDGVRSGKSGWSFGLCQFDTRNNGEAIKCLVDCGFTHDEIHGVVDQTIDVVPLAARLIAHKEIVDRYDMVQLQHCLDSAGNFAANHNIPLADSAAFLMTADTVNQFGSLGDGSAAHLLALSKPVTADDILAMKLTWKYATQVKGGKEDTKRRYSNVITVVKNNG